MMLKQLLFSAALATVAISASAESKVLWQSEDPAGKLVGWGDPALTLSAGEAAEIKAGDFLTMTVEGVDSENGWPQVALFQGNVGWPPAVNEGVGGKEYPFVASFGVTPEFADSIHAYGIVFKGDGAYVSAVGLKEGTINVNPNTVWFGPKQCGWGNGVSISKEVFSEVAPGAKIVVEYDKEVAEHTLQFLFGGWSGLNIPTYEAWKTDFLTNDEEAGTYTIELNSSLSDLTWGAEGEEQKYDVFALLKEGGLIMHGPCTVNQVLYIPAPQYPEKLDLTLNGQKELSGVSVTQEMVPFDGEDYLTITVKGKCDADEITIEMATPKGWDGMYVFSEYGGGDIEPLKIKAKAPAKEGEDYWMPAEYAGMIGLQSGNTLTFVVNGEEQNAMVCLAKGDQIYTVQIDFIFEVKTLLQAANQEAYDNVIAKLDDLQAKYDKAINGIKETNPDFDFSEWEEIGKMIKETRTSALQALNSANEDGEAFNFAFDGEEIDAYITMMLMEGTVAPAFPESYNVSLSDNQGVEATQNIDQGVHTISVSGKSPQKEITLTLAVPEGWDGFVVMNAEDFNPWIEPLSTRTEETEWNPVGALLESGFTESNSITFPVDGEVHSCQFMLVKNGLVDVANQINVDFEVEYDLMAANQADYDEVVAKIVTTQKEYEVALNELTEEYPEYDFSEWKEIIGGALNQALEGAKQALESANEDGEEFLFPFDSEYYEGMIAEMNAKVPLLAANQAAYVEVVAKIEALQKEYEAALKEAEEANPDYDFSEWKEIIAGALDQALEGAEQALYSANEDGEEFKFAFDGEELEAMIAEMKKAPLMDANQAAYVEVVAKIEALQKEYEAALKEAEETNPDYDFSEWKEIIAGALNQELEGAEQALNSANEDGEAFQFAFDGEEIEAMIAEMKKAPLMDANQAAYNEVVEKIEALQKDYEVALKESEEANPDYDFSEWKEIIAGALDQALEGAEQALYSANEDGEAYQFAFDGEEFEAMIAEMKKAPLMEANQADYDKVMAEIDAVKAEYEKAVSEIETEYPEFDMTEMKGIIENAISEAEDGAEKALNVANEDGEAFFFPFSTEEIENMIAQLKEDAATSGVNGVNAADKAIYYDLDGNRINNPKAGMYVKIVDGKATKVVVK